MKKNSDYTLPPSYTNKAILHIDGDAFFASIEQAKNYRLKGKPVVTGGERYIAAAMSYEAKARGVTRGMKLSDIKKICPDAIVCNSDYVTYTIFARRMYNIVRSYTEVVEEYSIDECFADITGMNEVFGMSYYDLGQKIKIELETKLGITFGVGLSSTKVLAKIASKYNKPSGYTVIGKNFDQCTDNSETNILKTHESGVHKLKTCESEIFIVKTNEASTCEIKTPETTSYEVKCHEREFFLKHISIDSVWGIGNATSRLLRKHMIYTAHDFVLLSELHLSAFSISKPYREIYQELKGISVLPIYSEKRSPPKSIICTKTFTPSTRNEHVLYSQLSKNVEKACERLRTENMSTYSFNFFIKSQDFKYYTQECILSVPTANPKDILLFIKKNFSNIYNPYTTYRASGISFTKLISDQEISKKSIGLFDECVIHKLENKNKKIRQDNSVSKDFKPILKQVDLLNKKFGEQTVMFGSSVTAVLLQRKKECAHKETSQYANDNRYDNKYKNLDVYNKKNKQQINNILHKNKVWEIPLLGTVRGLVSIHQKNI